MTVFHTKLPEDLKVTHIQQLLLPLAFMHWALILPLSRLRSRVFSRHFHNTVKWKHCFVFSGNVVCKYNQIHMAWNRSVLAGEAQQQQQCDRVQVYLGGCWLSEREVEQTQHWQRGRDNKVLLIRTGDRGSHEGRLDSGPHYWVNTHFRNTNTHIQTRLLYTKTDTVHTWRSVEILAKEYVFQRALLGC